MAARLGFVRSFFTPLVMLALAPVLQGQAPATVTPAQAQAMVERALANELRTAQDHSHPMRYRLRKSSSRLTSTKEMVETRDGAVARLVAINDKPLSEADEQKEEARLAGLLSDPGRQRHRKQNEDEDTTRALKVLRALPTAFLYQFSGATAGSGARVEKFAFRPNPAFTPPDLETQLLTAMTGELWIDPVENRVIHLEGHLQKDVDFGWGILGRLYKGGWIVIEQTDVGAHQWRIVRFQMAMSGRVVFKNKNFDTVEVESGYTPVPSGLNYRQGIQMLRGNSGGTAQASR